MKRIDFIKNTAGASLGAFTLGRSFSGQNQKKENNLRASICKANDRRVEELLNRSQQISESTSHHRSQSGFILALSAAYCSEISIYYQDTKLISSMQLIAEALLQYQNSDGTFNFGNMESPPDSAFMIEQLFRAQALLLDQNSNQTEKLRKSVKVLILNTAEALIVGGVHTPNHRWAVCAALAGTHSIYPNQKYLDRIDEWLGEGIGQDADGQHPERSPNYDSSVNNPSLLDVAIYLNKRELLDHVRKNLEMTIYLTELNGEIETVASRRQDQDRSIMIYRYYLPYRYLAIQDKNYRFAEVARMIESKYMAHLGEHLADFMLHDELNNELPANGTLPDTYVKHLENSDLARIRRGKKSATIFGGTDWHLGHGAWSGLSHNPTFFKLRNGDAILESIRMSPKFFRTGYFRSDGLAVNGDEYSLKEVRHALYHQPLPEKFRNEDGVYKMSPDGRFYSSMDFENRPKDHKSLASDIKIRELGGIGEFEIDFTVAQVSKVPVVIELCFRKGGQLSGVVPIENDADGYFLSEGYGSYSIGSDVIEFGPGQQDHTSVNNLEYEQYAVHNGGIHLDGYRVYITGITPFQYSLKIG